MHIVFLTNEYPKKDEPHGGIGSFVKFLAEKLIAKGYGVSILGINNNCKNEFSNQSGIKIYRLKKSTWKFAKFYQHKNRILKKLKEIHNENPIDIVEGSELNFAFFPKRTPYKKLIRLHGGHHFFARELNKKPVFWRGYQEKKSFKNADIFIAVSNYVGNQTKKYLKSNFDFSTIYNGIQLDYFYESDTEKEVPFRLLFIGTVCEKKGIHKLIEALPVIKNKFPNVHLDIIGRDWFMKNGKSYINYLKKTINENIKDSVSFRGNIPYSKIPYEIEKAQICVYPSLAESFGLTIIEAMSMGKSIAASNIEPFKEIVADSNSVSFFNPNNSKEITEKICELLSDHSLRQQLITRSRNHIFNRFDSSKIVEQNITFYKSVI